LDEKTHRGPEKNTANQVEEEQDQQTKRGTSANKWLHNHRTGTGALSEKGRKVNECAYGRFKLRRVKIKGNKGVSKIGNSNTTGAKGRRKKGQLRTASSVNRKGNERISDQNNLRPYIRGP